MTYISKAGTEKKSKVYSDEEIEMRSRNRWQRLFLVPAALITGLISIGSLISFVGGGDRRGDAFVFLILTSIPFLVCLKKLKSIRRSERPEIAEEEEKERIAKEAHREDIKKFKADKKVFVDAVSARANSKPIEVLILGGLGWEHEKEKKFLFSIENGTIWMSDLSTFVDVKIPVEDLREIDISGPGTVKSSAGISGGGFGMEGAAKGMAAAALINMITSHSETKTVVRLRFENAELVMLTSEIEPDEARILLSPLYIRIHKNSPLEGSIGISGELQKLHELVKTGALTSDEYERLKMKIIG